MNRPSAKKKTSRSSGRSPTPVRVLPSDNVEDTKFHFLKIVNKNFKLFSVRLGLDMGFLFLVLALLIMGMTMMFSASYPSGFAYQDDSFFYLRKQLVFAAIGIAAMFLLSYLDYHYFHLLAYVVLIIALVALGLVLVIPSDSDVKRWISVFGITIQPSEIAKLAVILVMADVGSRFSSKMGTFRYGVVLPFALMILICGLLFFEPHYSGIAIIGMLTLLMMFLGGTKKRWFLVIGGILAAGIALLAVTGKLGYAMERLDGWGQALNPPDNMWWKTYQTRNSIYAIGSGGFWGLGLGMSRQKYLYIPEVQNDFVFAVVCEELGFLGAAFILFVFGLLVYRGIKISMQAKDKFGSLLGVGLSAQIGLQVILNILVITDGMPNTGISLPFFSYGGSSLVMLLAQMGIVLSVSRTATLEKV